jgi:hypothetical protein
MAEIDDIFHEFAAAFAGAFRDSKPICFPDRLDRSKLDLTLASPKIMDTYLTHLHRNSTQLKDDVIHPDVACDNGSHRCWKNPGAGHKSVAISPFCHADYDFCRRGFHSICCACLHAAFVHFIILEDIDLGSVSDRLSHFLSQTVAELRLRLSVM